MKKIVLMLSFVLAGCFIQTNVSAQAAQGSSQARTYKLGYINSSELIDKMPERAVADTAIAKYMRQLSSSYQTMTQEMQKKYQEYQDQKDNWTAAVREAKEKDLSDLQQRLEEFQSNARDSIDAKRSTLYKPLYDRAQQAIQNVGKDGGYDYIFDGASLLYAKDAENLTSKVKAKLGIK